MTDGAGNAGGVLGSRAMRRMASRAWSRAPGACRTREFSPGGYRGRSPMPERLDRVRGAKAQDSPAWDFGNQYQRFIRKRFLGYHDLWDSSCCYGFKGFMRRDVGNQHGRERRKNMAPSGYMLMISVG